MSTLWDPIKLGKLLRLRRFAMVPMTRSRANADGTPGPLAARYYVQHASPDLPFSQSRQPPEDGRLYLRTPGIRDAVQRTGWQKVTSACTRASGAQR
jgi:N-ethylmaleimide reductase